VLASDSLSTLAQSFNQKMTVSGKCDKCGETVEIKDVQTPPVNIPSSSWPYVQKLFPIQGRFGLATYGLAFVNQRSIYNHIIELAPSLPNPSKDDDHFGVLSGLIAAHFHKELEIQLKAVGLVLELQPDGRRLDSNSLDSRRMRPGSPSQRPASYKSAKPLRFPLSIR